MTQVTEDRPNGPWNYHPPLPIGTSPLFAWPPRPLQAAGWLATRGFLISDKIALVLMAFATWAFLQPPLAGSKAFAAGWILPIYGRNIMLMLLVAGGLHLYFHTYRKQGMVRKFDPRQLVRNGGRFLWKNQIWDNIAYTLGFGVLLWTAYEVLLIWGYSNGFAPMLEWRDNRLWFVLLFVLIPIFQSMHFYWIHRLLHWRPLYDRVHSLHHKNVNVGPWSGLAMHPLEHLLYFSTVLIHFIVPTNPVHMIFHLQYLTLGAITSHTGFESLMVRNRPQLVIGSFFHQLHHKYFECNYGTFEMPWDRWFGSFHDGTQDATRRIRQRMAKRRG
jgi:sterol desaturase/sphingolipid hydroxylase (fatty acid hydroxylase superfamily)